MFVGNAAVGPQRQEVSPADVVGHNGGGQTLTTPFCWQWLRQASYFIRYRWCERLVPDNVQVVGDCNGRFDIALVARALLAPARAQPSRATTRQGVQVGAHRVDTRRWWLTSKDCHCALACKLGPPHLHSWMLLWMIKRRVEVQRGHTRHGKHRADDHFRGIR